MFASLRFADRSLLRSPASPPSASSPRGPGIGANTAMFSMINSIVLKPQSDQLERIDRVTPQNPQSNHEA
jgi:hypothetical protein